VALRTLKSIANNKELGLIIQALELVRYDERQLDILFKHDIVYDETLPMTAKSEDARQAYHKMFREAKQPTL
jgi:hypothetical protein